MVHSNSHGPMFIGFVFNVLLYGIMVTQVYLYFTTFKKYFQAAHRQTSQLNPTHLPRDKKWMKLFVCSDQEKPPFCLLTLVCSCIYIHRF